MNSNKSHVKHLTSIIILFCVMFLRPTNSIGAVAPSSSQNFIITYCPNEAISATSDLSGMDNSKTCPTIQYFDGLGRPTQTVVVGAVGTTSNYSDLISHIEYDEFGRQKKAWSPFAISNNNGAYINPTSIPSLESSFYNNTNGIPTESMPYTLNYYEPSPLNRLVVGMGPGANWQNNNKGISHFWYTNDQSDSLIVHYLYVGTNNVLQKNGTYSDGSLYVTADLDEDGHKTWTFTDKQGRTILTRTYNNAGNEGENGYYSTYYVYDDLDRLRFVLPPMASAAINTSNDLWNPNSSDSNNFLLYGYYYRYDARGNCILKKLPGALPLKMVYDKAERLVLSQDGNQSVSNHWSFQKNDSLGRPVMKGSIVLSPTTQSHDILIDYYKNLLVVESFDSTLVSSAGYTNGYFTGRDNLFEVFYYDSYSFLNIYYSLVPQAARTTIKWNTLDVLDTPNFNGKGLLTGHVNALTSNQNLKTYKAIFYDNKGRVVAEKSTNQQSPNNTSVLGIGFDNYAYSYDFKGNVLHSRHRHRGIPSSIILYDGNKFTYDQAGRLTMTKHYLANESNAVITSTNSFNDLGQLRTRILGNNLDTQTYDYNIRGWLTSMYGSCFVEKLYYETTPTGAGYYNGNISQSDIRYHAGDYNASRALGLTPTTGGVGFQYNYTYDDLNRLKLAVTPNSSQTPNGMYAYGEQLSYDLNGNITDLGRGGIYQYNWENAYTPDHDFLVLDNLNSSDYVGNQIQSYYDSGIDAYYTGALDFKSNPNYATQYYYDNNGNMIANFNKNIPTIQYNQLNLPETVQFSYGQMVSYSYDATGKKTFVIRRTPTQTSLPAMPLGSTLYLNNTPGYTVASTIATMYLDNAIYENGTMSSTGGLQTGAITKLQIPDGILSRTNSISSVPTFKRNYYIKDHLGNVRVVLDETNTIQQVNNYYPFGMEFGESAESQTKLNYQNYLAGGKEFDRKFEMNTYDFGARTYDASIGRWTTMDPLAEKYYSISPYAYCGNNPVMFVDPNGMDYGLKIDDETRTVTVSATYYTNKESLSSANKAVKSYNEMSGKNTFKVGSGENATLYTVNYDIKVVEVNTDITTLNDALSGDKTGTGNKYEVVSDTELGPDENGAASSNAIQVKKSASDSDTGSHEVGHTLGLAHTESGLMTPEQNNPLRSPKIENSDLNTIFSYPLSGKTNWDYDRLRNKVNTGRGTVTNSSSFSNKILSKGKVKNSK